MSDIELSDDIIDELAVKHFGNPGIDPTNFARAVILADREKRAQAAQGDGGSFMTREAAIEFCKRRRPGIEPTEQHIAATIDAYSALFGDLAPVPMEARPCTCHPDDNPPQPCAQKYALTECRATEASKPVQAEAPSDDADPLTPEQEEWVMDVAEKHNLGRRIGQIATMRGKYPDVFYTDASYRTHELFCFAAELLATKQAEAPTARKERTPKDYAIEHAEYMATSAVNLIAAVNDLAKAEQENEDGLAEQSDVDAARDTLTERLSALRDGIYEFRKRRDRAALATQQEAPDRSEIFTLLSALDVTYEEAMADELSRMQFWSKVQLARKATQQEAQPQAERHVRAHLSWGGFNLEGDYQSIQEAKRLLHEAGTVPDLKALLAEARAAQAEPAGGDKEDAGLPPKYMLAKLQMVMPLFQEARDALTAVTETQRRLHGISSSLDVRMDEAGTFSLDDWLAARAAQQATGERT